MVGGEVRQGGMKMEKEEIKKQERRASGKK